MKTLLIITFLSLLFISACSQADKQTADNIGLIEKYVKAVEGKDYSTMESLLAENYKGYGPSHSDSTNKAAALASWKENIENLYQSISYNRSRMAAVTVPEGPNKGEWVANWAELKISYRDGRGPVIIWANTNYQIENGKIVKSYTFYNEADALRQLGYELVDRTEY
jgi:hypothetical protein